MLVTQFTARGTAGARCQWSGRTDASCWAGSSAGASGAPSATSPGSTPGYQSSETGSTRSSSTERRPSLSSSAKLKERNQRSYERKILIFIKERVASSFTLITVVLKLYAYYYPKLSYYPMLIIILSLHTLHRTYRVHLSINQEYGDMLGQSSVQVLRLLITEITLDFLKTRES